MTMKHLIPLLAAIFLFACSTTEEKAPAYPIKAVNLNQVTMADQFWLPRIKLIQKTTIPFALDKCETEGRMDNFLIAGGVKEGKTRGVMPFDDTDLYKIIEGASYSLVMAPDTQLDRHIDSLISIIATGQEEDGYLTTYKTIDTTYAPAHWCPAGGRWKDLACSHELYNSGHLFEAAAAHYWATGKDNFLNIALKNADLLVDVFNKEGNPDVPGHQIVETGLVKLYQITGKKDYLELSKHFLDSRGDSTLRQTWGPYNQDHLPVTQQDEVVGHAVRAVYMYAGMTDMAALYNDEAYLEAVNKLWENMVNKKMYITGGIGSRHDGEAFGKNYELPNLTAYCETCAAIGSVLWSHKMFLLTGDVKYFDIIERTLYNGVIPGLSLDGMNFFYPNPLESDGVYTFNKGACTRSPWFDCSCCPTNLIRFIPFIPNLYYATAGDSLYINLFATNEANISLNGTEVGLKQKTKYPWKGNIKINVNPTEPSAFTIKLHIPGWAKNIAAPGNLYAYTGKTKARPVVKVNDKETGAYDSHGYLAITREWKAGDVIDINLPMKVKKVVTNEKVETNRGLTALEYGPLVYCAEEADNPDIPFTLPEKTKFEVNYNPELLGGVNVLTANNGLTLIPYYAWSNRGCGKMKVWLPEE
jgi:hypothetical protein